jgi:hypothetical protein
MKGKEGERRMSTGEAKKDVRRKKRPVATETIAKGRGKEEREERNGVVFSKK